MAQYRQNRIAEEIRKNLDRIIREEMKHIVLLTEKLASLKG